MNHTQLQTDSDFQITIDLDTGTIFSLINKADTHMMNWLEGHRRWGEVTCLDSDLWDLNLTHIRTSIDTSGCISEFTTSELGITVERGFTPEGGFREIYTFKNTTDYTITFSESDLGIFTPFNDSYQDFETCSTQRCHAHIWCGESSSYVNALRMGGEPPHLGLVLTSGSISDYSIVRTCSSNDRGDFILHPSWFTLAPGETYELSWLLFWHSGEQDFYEKASQVEGFIHIEANHFTAFSGEQIFIEIKASHCADAIEITSGGRLVRTISESGSIMIQEAADTIGERSYRISQGRRHTFARVLVVPELKDLIRARCQFIIEKQQFLRENDPLHGAYLIYDNESGQLCYGHRFWDHGAGREKFGMGVLLAALLSSDYQIQNRELFEQSLRLYYQFVERELYAQLTGTVYNRIGKSNDQWHRLYNYPWIINLQMELFKVTDQKEYLLKMVKTIEAYYEHGGARFYSLCLPMVESVKLLEDSGLMAQSKSVRKLFLIHADTIVYNGTAYPAHEVDYEQSIVAPAASYTLQAYLLSNDERYLKAAQKHISILELFNGNQPDYHLNRISIRHWDGFWFGKRKLYGDTFPHYWSVLSAEVFYYYHKITGIERYHRMCQTILRNNLCLFDQSGFGSCAYLYPYSINDKYGKFFDPWANDQDWALIYAMRFLDQH